MDNIKETNEVTQQNAAHCSESTGVTGEMEQNPFLGKPRVPRSPTQKANTPASSSPLLRPKRITRTQTAGEGVAKAPPVPNATSLATVVIAGNSIIQTPTYNEEISVEGRAPLQDPAIVQTPVAAEEAKTTEEETGSPRQEFVLKMRAEEEAALEKCLRVLRKMKSAISKQKNISMDIKTGVSELDELFDVMKNYRRGWLQAEKSIRLRSVTTNAIGENSMDTPVAARKESCQVVENMSSAAKRTAPSPAAPDSSKKSRTREPEKWQTISRKKPRPQGASMVSGGNRPPLRAQTLESRTVGNAKNKRKRERAPKSKSEAVLVKPAEGHSYAEVLKNLRSRSISDETATVKGIRRTRAGALLLELEKGKAINPDFVRQLEETVKEVASVTTLRPTMTVEIRDLDAVTEKKEVEAAVRKVLINTAENIEVRVTAPNAREQVRAYVTLASESAEKLLQAKNIKVGWVSARMRANISLKRCFRCFGVGHLRMDCKGPDRSGKGLCIRCGDAGHKMKECTKEPRCCLCTDAKRNDVKHMPGSGKCPMSKEKT